MFSIQKGQYYLGIWFLVLYIIEDWRKTNWFASKVHLFFTHFTYFCVKTFTDDVLSIIWVMQFLQKSVFFIVASRNVQMFIGIYILLILKGDCKLLF